VALPEVRVALVMTNPALEAMAEALRHDDIINPEQDAERAMEDAQAALAAASDPKLGLNRLVSVREVVEALRSDECYDVVDDNEPTAWGVLTTAADFIESKFGEHGKAEEA